MDIRRTGTAVDEYLTFGSVVEPRDEADERGFAAAGLADEGDGLARFDRQIDIVQNGFAVVGKIQVAKFDLALDRRLLDRFGCIADRRLGLEYRVESLERRRAALIEIDDIPESDQIPDHPLQIEYERCKIARRDLAANRHRNADRHYGHKAQADEKEKQRTHRRSEFYELDVSEGVFAVEFLKLFDLGVFLCVCTNDADAGQVFLRPGRDVGKERLDLLKPHVDLAAEEFDRQR